MPRIHLGKLGRRAESFLLREYGLGFQGIGFRVSGFVNLEVWA